LPQCEEHDKSEEKLVGEIEIEEVMTFKSKNKSKQEDSLKRVQSTVTDKNTMSYKGSQKDLK
jgi:hypothetical protein